MSGFDLETDTDADTVPDCADLCPFEDDLADLDADGMADCLQSEFIPTLSHWGVVALALAFLVAAKICFKRPEDGRPVGS